MSKPPLPRAQVTLTCQECGLPIVEFDVNVQSLASELAAARRAHAIRRHGWRPLPAGTNAGRAQPPLLGA